MEVFHTDLDNTLIYSYKHDIGNDKINVEMYEGREVSFMTKKTWRLLLELQERMLVVPTTTRTQEQYGRIGLKAGNPRYALVCNGGVLLVDGRSDGAWYGQSLKMVQDSQDELQKAIGFLETEKNRKSEIRYIQELFVFTKCQRPKGVAASLGRVLDTRLVDVFQNGEKIYVIPKRLDKGTAVLRFREYIGDCRVFAAGDSVFDIPMLVQADLAAAPPGLGGRLPQGGHIHIMPGREVFSEEMLEFMLKGNRKL